MQDKAIVTAQTKPL